MAGSRAAQVARLGARLRGFLANPVETATATRRLRARVELRDQRFLEVIRRLIYGHESSPYRALLAFAGCEYADLESGVRRDGLEATLERLRRAGVYVTLDELKCTQPIVRGGMALKPRHTDFDSPLLLGRAVTGTTSGSRSRRSRIHYDWHGLAEEADNALLLDTVHRVAEVPLALWFPAPPGVAGLRNVLLAAKCGRPPERWFSQAPGWIRPGKPLALLSLQYMRWQARRLGMRLPAPQYTPLDHAGRVAQWLAPSPDAPPARTIRTVTSSAVRIATVALAEGRSLEAATAVIGGEPLSAERRRLIESAGLRVVNRYATAEAGIVAAACGRETSPDAMHLYSDRVAALQRPEGLLLTSLSPFTGKVLLNASLGDQGELRERSCDCAFGMLGMSTWISGLGSDERVTIEGMTFRLADLHEVVTRALADRGAKPDDCQLWRLPERDGMAKLAVVVAPRVRVERAAVAEAIFDELSRRGELGRLTAAVWSQAQALEVVAADPRISPGQKLLPVSSAPPRR